MVLRKHGILCLALVPLLAGALALTQIRIGEPVPDLHDMLNQPKTAMEMNLYAANRDAKTGKSVSGMTLGYDFRTADGTRKLRTFNQYESGATENIFYRVDESKEWSEDFYPLRDGDTSPVKRSLARFAEDGKTYVSHDVKREDGSWERQGKLLADGNYQQTYFCADGKTPEKVQLFDRDKRFISETAIFCDTGKPVRELLPGDDEKTLKLYREDGSVASKIRAINGWEVGTIYDGEVYRTNGSVHLHFNTSGYGGQVDVFFAPGRVEMSWLEYTMTSNLEFTMFDKNAPASVDAATQKTEDPKRKLFQQTWKLREAFKRDSGWILVKVTEFEGKKELRTIEMSEDGKHPVRIIVPTAETSKTIVHSLDASGKRIVKAVLHETGKKEDIAQALPAQLDVKIPAALLKSYERPDVPAWDDGTTNTGTRVYDFH